MIGSRTTPLFALAIAVTATGASAQHSTARKPGTSPLSRSAQGQRPTSPTQVTIAGRILMPDGSAATGVRLFLARNVPQGSAQEEVKVDAAGRFRHTVNYQHRTPGESVVLSAIVPGKATLWSTYTSDKALSNLTLRLEPAGTLTGQVVDVDGKPLPGIEVGVPQLTPDPEAFQSGPDQETILPFTAFLPAADLKALSKATTDANGRFTLSTLPAKGQVRLSLGPKVMLAPGSAAAINLGDRKQIDAGKLVAVVPGNLTLHLINRLTNKPATDIQVMVLPKDISIVDFAGAQDEEMQARLTGLVPDKQGNIALPHMTPGEYRIVVDGMERLVKVVSSQLTYVDFAIRTGAFVGRIVDATGKPVAGVPVTFDASPDPLKDLFGFAGITEGRQSTQEKVVTDQKGQFTISPFPWEATTVTIRGAQGNAEALWSGPARNIGKTLDLRLRSGALVTVKGHLTDPAGKHVKGQTVSLIRWQDAPRITWLINAKPVKVDAQGYFQVDGLQRGEGFSLLAGSSFGGGRATSAEGFESPRFTTNQGTGVQNLGDLVVHPVDDSQQILQLYGIGSLQQLAQLSALMPSPSTASSDGAREALTRYGSALAAGDFATVHRLTSTVSTGWSADLQEFMTRSKFETPELKEVEPLRFVPGISLAYLLAFGKAGASPLNFSFGTAASELQANPDWVVFVSPGKKSVQIAGLLRREQGEWKVVSSPSLLGSGLGSVFLLDEPGETTPQLEGFHKPARAPEAAQIDAARATGEKYLTAWFHGDDATQLALTSPLSPGAATNLVELRKTRSRRADEGICPVRDMSALNLTPLKDLTQWESEWLAQYALKFHELAGQSNQGGKAGSKAEEGFPNKYVERGDLLPFSYTADGRDFLILLVRAGDKWQVLEPSIPM